MMPGPILMLTEVVLPFAGVGFAVAASIFALRRVPLEFYENGPDDPEFRILSNRVAIYKLAEPNKRAALCALIAALFGAIGPIWVLIQRIL